VYVVNAFVYGKFNSFPMSSFEIRIENSFPEGLISLFGPGIGCVNSIDKLYETWVIEIDTRGMRVDSIILVKCFVLSSTKASKYRFQGPRKMKIYRIDLLFQHFVRDKTDLESLESWVFFQEVDIIFYYETFFVISDFDSMHWWQFVMAFVDLRWCIQKFPDSRLQNKQQQQ